ncbi:Ca-activated chloride channel family protein [Saccharicrinis carchari]|uniref:Ca-activated chloride channel family protein n=2 Tax=Saccharicrinis carchari TaxID=1168039 RepID=A0A521BRA5_SACCC|nr:Ca-activated chloride channel family protein [Saccharicrinis carchari]
MKTSLSLILCFCITLEANAQNNITPSPIIFIYDASGSMWGQMQGQTKMEIATEVLTTAISKLPDNQKIGLVAYGHRKEGDCADVEFLVDAESGSKAEVITSIKGIKPLGKTPLAYSASQVIDKLRQTKLSATVILITDGIESCDGNICNVIKAAKEEGIDFKIHIIGFGLKSGETGQLQCAAQAGNGYYYDASDADGLSDVLQQATAITIDKPEGNVSVYAIKNGIPIDAWIKAYDIVAKRRPISVRTYGDTAYFYLPPSKYNFEVRPLGGSDVDMITIPNIESFEDKMVHQTISFDGGILGITTTNNGKNWDCIVKLFDANNKMAAYVRTYQTPKEVEVNPGIYKITVQALAMNGTETKTQIKDLTIIAGQSTPVSYDFKTGNFQIYTKAGNENIDAVVTVKETSTGTRVASSRTYTKGAKFLLNPGIYEVKAAPLGEHKTKAAQTFTVEVRQGELTTKEIKF